MNTLKLAVAGGRKTQSLVESCGKKLRTLVLGYTIANQTDLERRINEAHPFQRHTEVLGWYSFLLQHIIGPYLPLLFPGRRLAGLNFDGDPGRYTTGVARYLDPEDRAYKLHLSKLASDVMSVSNGAVLDRLEHIFECIYIDEVQDLGGWDLEIIAVLLRSKLSVHMVGDLRQAVLSTNIQDPKNKQYRFEKILTWFKLQEKANVLKIVEAPETHRSNQVIATFSDSVFAASCGYPATIAVKPVTTGHDGVFVVSWTNLAAYTASFAPICLRYSIASAKGFDVEFRNFGAVKGLTFDRVTIFPTQKIDQFLKTGIQLDGKSACGLYIAVTRARHSVTFIVKNPAGYSLPEWTP